MDNFIRCHESVQVACGAILPSVKKVIEDWHQRLQGNLGPCSSPTTCPTKGKPTTKKGSCQSCVNWGQAIENSYYPQAKVSAIQWSNINSTLLCKDPIECVKAFVLRLPQGHVYKCLEDFDAASVLMIMMQFKAFHHGDQMIYEKILKVSTIRNNLSHMKIGNQMVLDDTTTAQNFDEIIDLITALDPLYFTQDEVYDLVIQIKQIQSLPVSTRMREEALHPLTEAMKKMVQQQQKFQEQFQAFTDNMQSKHTVALDVELCRRQLREHYLQIMCKIPKYPGDSESFIDMDKLYTNLSILYEMTEPCAPIRIPLISHNEIFTRKVNGILPNRILVLGKGGSGKSTLLAKIAYDWATCDAESPLKDLPLLFVVNMRGMQPDTNLEDAILHQLLPEDTQISKESLISYMKQNPSYFVILLDSYDEFSRGEVFGSTGTGNVLRLLSNNCLTSCQALVTSRHWRASDFANFQRLYAKIEIDGFSEDNVREYIRKYFQNDEGSGERLCEYIADHNLYGIASFPLMSQLLCLLWSEGKGIPNKIGELYTAILQLLYDHFQSKGTSVNCSSLNEMIVQLGEVACLGLWPPENRLIFPRQEMIDIASDQCVKDGCKAGIISLEKTVSRGKKEEHSIIFFHKSGQEKCAGDYLAHLTDTNPDEFVNKLEVLQSAKTCLSVQMILRFACGASQKAAKYILQKLIEIAKSESQVDLLSYYKDKIEAGKAKEVQEFIEMCLICNYESRSTGEFSYILLELFPTRRLKFLGMSSYTAMAIGYFLTGVRSQNTITEMKITEIPRTGFLECDFNSNAIDRIFVAAQNTLQTKSRDEIQHLFDDYVDSHKEMPNMDRFAEDLKDNSVGGLCFIELWEYFKTWNSTTGKTELVPIFDALQHTQLNTLNLTGVNLGNQGQHLVTAIEQNHLSSLTHLLLSATGLSAQHMNHMVALLQQYVPKLKVLDISHNYASDGQVIHNLAQCLPSMSLQELRVNNMYAPAEDMTTLAKTLPDISPHLHTLEMIMNDMDDETGITLAKILPYAHRLNVLAMGVNGMSRQVQRNVVMTTEKLTQLQNLEIYNFSYLNDIFHCMAKVLVSLPNLRQLTLYFEPIKFPIKKFLSMLKGIKKPQQSSCDNTEQVVPMVYMRSSWQTFMSSLQAKAEQMIKLGLFNIKVHEADVQNLLELCREHDIQLGYSRRLWPDGIDIPQDISIGFA